MQVFALGNRIHSRVRWSGCWYLRWGIGFIPGLGGEDAGICVGESDSPGLGEDAGICVRESDSFQGWVVRMLIFALGNRIHSRVGW